MSELRYVARRGWTGRDRLAKPRNSNLDFGSGEQLPGRLEGRVDNAPLRSEMAARTESCPYTTVSKRWISRRPFHLVSCGEQAWRRWSDPSG